MLYSMSTQKDKKNYQAVLGETAGDLLPGAGFRQLFGLCYRARVTGETPARAVPGQTIVRIAPPVKPDPGNPDHPEPEPEQFIGLCSRQVAPGPDSVQKW